MPAFSSQWGNKHLVAQLLGTNFATKTSYTANTDCADLGDVKAQSDKLTPSITREKNVAGDTVATDVTYEGETTATYFSKKKSLIDYFSVNVRSNPYHLEIMDLGIEQGSYQEVFKIVFIAANRERSANQYGVPYTATSVTPKTAVTFSTTNLSLITTALSTTIHTTTAVTIAAGTDSTTIETPLP